MQSYDAQEIDGSQEEYTVQLAENEEIFGIYGVKDVSDHFTSFGIIAKVNRDFTRPEKPQPVAAAAEDSILLSPIQLSERSPVKVEEEKKQVKFTINP